MELGARKLVSPSPTTGGVFYAIILVAGCVRSGGESGGISAGENFVWLCVISSGFNLDYFNMTAAAAAAV